MMKSTSSRRQDPISCSLCRRKKLRCNRQHPCSNCVARNVACEREGSLPASAPVQQQSGTIGGAATFTAINTASTDTTVLARLDRLESLILQLNGHDRSTSSPSGIPILQQRTPDSITSPLMDADASEAAHVVDTKILEDVGTRGYSLLSGLSDGIHFEVISLKQIPTAPLQPRSHRSTQVNTPRTIFLPTLSESLLLLDIYAEHVEYLHHIVLISKVRSQIHALYTYLADTTYARTHNYPDTSRTPALAPAALILSIFASAAACLAEIRPFALAKSPSLSILSIPGAKVCSIQWTKAAFECLEHSRHIGSGCIEDVQATVTVFFLMYNLEGFTARTRTGFGHGFAVAKDLGLHRLDFALDWQHRGAGRDPVDTEIARRVWWHMVASDWVVALSGGPQEGVYFQQPRHMQVNLPRNINDSDLLDPTKPIDFEEPLSVPTSSSYLIQRIKLATICRKIVDAMPMSPSRPDLIPYDEVIALDMEFEQLLQDLPPFFQIEETQGATPYIQAVNFAGGVEASQIATQRFMIRITTHTRRCKFHQPFLVRGFTDPKYHYSRDVCLRSARVVIGIQQELDNEGIVATGLLGLSGLNHHLFFATIALVMDLCFNREEGPGKEERESERKKEVWRACRILEDAKERSMPARRFLESLMDVLRKHRVKLVDPGETVVSSAGDVGPTGNAGRASEQGVATLEVPHAAEAGQPSDFEEIWQTYIDNAPTLDVENWEDLFNDLDGF